MFLMYATTVVFALISIALFLPLPFGGEGEMSDPEINPAVSQGEALGVNMLGYHRLAVSFANENPNFRGVVPEGQLDMDRIGEELLDWVSVVEDSSDDDKVDIFTYANEVSELTSPSALASGLMKANGYGFGTNIVGDENQLRQMRGMSTFSSNDAAQRGVRDVYLSRDEDDNPITVPENITPGTVIQHTRLGVN